MRVVICGGGVIGACAAYFLSRRGIDVTVVERAEVAAAASRQGWRLPGSRLVRRNPTRCAGTTKLTCFKDQSVDMPQFASLPMHARPDTASPRGFGSLPRGYDDVSSRARTVN